MSDGAIEHRTGVATAVRHVPTRRQAETNPAIIRCLDMTILTRELNWYIKVEERVP